MLGKRKGKPQAWKKISIIPSPDKKLVSRIKRSTITIWTTHFLLMSKRSEQKVISIPNLRHCSQKAKILYHKLKPVTLESIQFNLPRGETELICIEYLCARPYTRHITVFYHLITLILL